MKIAVLVLFIATYIALLVFQKYRAYIACGVAILFIIMQVVPLNQLFSIIDWNVLMMIAGTMGTVFLFIQSKMPSRLADIIIDKAPNAKWAILALALFAGIISAFVDNVATVLMIAPIALTISKKLDISPIPSVIAIAVSSNLQGAATLVGDTTSILLGGYANLNFLDFFFFDGKVGIFWVVEAGALMAMLILLFLFRKYKQPISSSEKTVVKDFFPSILMLGTVVLLILASFIPNKPAITNGLICVGLFVIGLIVHAIKERKTTVFKLAIKEIDFFTILLLGSLFVVVSAIEQVGLIKDMSNIFVQIGGDNLFVIYTLVVFVSVLLSAFIDNIPYVATMLPVMSGISAILGVPPYLLYFGLLIGATLGGNLTPIGASANITAIGILKKAGYEVKTKDFMKIGVPFTIAAVITGYLLIWFIYA